jgi:NNP family nitrate/nitrite transporter-like MFS transporter
MEHSSRAAGAFAEACRDRRVWALALLYAASFGIELTIDNIAALYFTDYFHLTLTTAGVVAGSFGTMNLFARALGGIVSDRCNRRWGLRGRVWLLGGTICAEGLAMTLFSQMRWLPLAIGTMMLTGLFVKMSNRANYSVVPFVNKRALGAVEGIVGAGGNLGAVLAGFLFKTPSLTYPQALLILGVAISACSGMVFAVRFSENDEVAARQEIEARLSGRLTPVPAMGD